MSQVEDAVASPEIVVAVGLEEDFWTPALGL